MLNKQTQIMMMIMDFFHSPGPSSLLILPLLLAYPRLAYELHYFLPSAVVAFIPFTGDNPIECVTLGRIGKDRNSALA